jgi:hypothetical protein
MKDRNLQSLAQLGFDHKTVGSFDVFEIDATKSGLKPCHRVDELLWIFGVDFDVDAVNVGKLLKQDSFALHDRFAGQGSNIS